MDDVGFVFRNFIQNATFIYGSDLVTAKKGSLVIFNGSVPHHTVVNSGRVNMVGPFKMDASMASVGGCAVTFGPITCSVDGIEGCAVE
jgi:hypothetical protein